MCTHTFTVRRHVRAHNLYKRFNNGDLIHQRDIRRCVRGRMAEACAGKWIKACIDIGQSVFFFVSFRRPSCSRKRKKRKKSTTEQNRIPNNTTCVNVTTEFPKQ